MRFISMLLTVLASFSVKSSAAGIYFLSAGGHGDASVELPSKGVTQDDKGLADGGDILHIDKNLRPNKLIRKSPSAGIHSSSAGGHGDAEGNEDYYYYYDLDNGHAEGESVELPNKGVTQDDKGLADG